MRNRIEAQTTWGFVLAFFGVLFYGEAFGTGRAYGYTTGNVIEFVVGTALVVAGTVLLYLAGMNSKRLTLASSDRRGCRISGISCVQVSRR